MPDRISPSSGSFLGVVYGLSPLGALECELLVDDVIIQRQSGWAAINDHADRFAVRFALSGYSKKCAKTVTGHVLLG